MKLRLLLSTALLPLTLAVAAQAADVAPSAVIEPAGDGVIGRVVDAGGAPLPGAEIVDRGTGRRVVSNTQGEFIMNGVSGRVELDVRYIGLPSVSQTVVATPGRLTSVTVTLGGGDVTTVADVVVTGVITEGVARSLNQQKNADGTINVLSADAIGRYPDPNVAESLQRVPGIAIQRDQGEGRYINVRGAPSAFTAVSVDGVTVPAVDPGRRGQHQDPLGLRSAPPGHQRLCGRQLQRLRRRGHSRGRHGLERLWRGPDLRRPVVLLLLQDQPPS